MNWLRNKKTSIVVHDGNFHPDDVFSVALLSIYFKDQIKVIRTRDEKVYSTADFVVDTGFIYDPSKNRFDHHQEGNAGFRNKDISYSSFGLVWKEYGEKVCGSKEVADIIDKKLVAVVDADDCGFDLHKSVINEAKPYSLLETIYALRPTWREDNLNINDCFLNAVAFAKEILVREIKATGDMVEAEKLVDEIYNNTLDKRIIIFEKYYLPKNLLCKYPEPLFVIHKNRVGEMWKAVSIEKFDGCYESRKNFPKSWWGKQKQDLAKVSGVADAIFCRNGGIFAGAESQAGAIRLAEIAINSK